MARPALDRSGFTLIELLVGMVIGSIVIGSLFQMITSQGRFVELQSAREEVQQNGRAAVELIGSELRTVAGGDALVLATEDSVTLRSPRVWGVVCAVTGAATLDVSVPSVTGASYTVNSGTGVVANVGTAAAPLWTNAVSATAVGAASNTCNGATLPAGSERRSVTMSAMPQNGATTPAIGHVLYLYDQVTYRTGTSSGVPGIWIQRRQGPAGNANQPLAGPVREGTGLKFQYFAEGSSAPIATPITSAATRATVTRVQVAIETLSRNNAGAEQEARSDTVVISLRNRL